MAATVSRSLLLIVCAAALLATVLGDHQTSSTYVAILLGANEVPKNDSNAAKNAVGDPQGIGYLQLTIYKDSDGPKWAKYEVNVHRLQGEMPPTKTHVHTGKKGKNGDVLLDLPCAYAKKGEGYWRCKGSLGKSKSDRTDALISALGMIYKRPSNYYGNIHTKRFPDGAIRGQLPKL
ncbi:hypothetical protein CLOP_g2733 [Closterium sp. NIES-67]|nr:hypothetical protein CLOP_g2733 [Closterium sp. NIES-67]